MNKKIEGIKCCNCLAGYKKGILINEQFNIISTTRGFKIYCFDCINKQKSENGGNKRV